MEKFVSEIAINNVSVFHKHFLSFQDYFIMEFVQFLDQGSWYISVYNDGEQPQQVAFIPNLTGKMTLAASIALIYYHTMPILFSKLYFNF